MSDKKGKALYVLSIILVIATFVILYTVLTALLSAIGYLFGLGISVLPFVSGYLTGVPILETVYLPTIFSWLFVLSTPFIFLTIIGDLGGRINE